MSRADARRRSRQRHSDSGYGSSADRPAGGWLRPRADANVRRTEHYCRDQDNTGPRRQTSRRRRRAPCGAALDRTTPRSPRTNAGDAGPHRAGSRPSQTRRSDRRRLAPGFPFASCALLRRRWRIKRPAAIMPPQLGPMWEYPQLETHPQSQLIRATVMRPAELVKDAAFSYIYRRRGAVLRIWQASRLPKIWGICHTNSVDIQLHLRKNFRNGGCAILSRPMLQGHPDDECHDRQTATETGRRPSLETRTPQTHHLATDGGPDFAGLGARGGAWRLR